MLDLFHKALSKYWPNSGGTDYLYVAARRCCGAMFGMAGLSGLAITIMNLRFLADYAFEVLTGGVMAVVVLSAPLFLGHGPAFKRHVAIVMSFLMLGLTILVMLADTILVSPLFLMIPSLMVIALILGPVFGGLSLLCAIAVASTVYLALHTGPGAAVNLRVDELPTLFFAIMTAMISCVVGALIYQAQMQHATKRLATALDEAETSTKAKSDFLASMSHEIRTPMNGIMGMSEAVLSGELPEEQRESVQTIRRSGEALLTIINEILDYSKIEAGELAIDLEPFDLTAVTQDVFKVLEMQAARKGISLELISKCLGAEWLLGDGVRVRQVLFNLVGNAVKFTESGGVRIFVTTVPHGSLVKVRLEVVDTGIGIEADKLEAIFDRFSQAETSITRRFGGTGLGLAITRHLVEAMGGRISVQSELGKGARFTVDLDLPQADTPEVLHDVTPGSDETLVIDGERPKVLVVDDNNINRMVVDHLLPTEQFSKVFASGGAEAIDLAAETIFDVILMDISMPDVSGFAALEAIRAAEASVGQRDLVPIVAFSAHAHAEELDRFAQAGFDDYLPKPVDKAMLVAMVRKWVDRPSEQRQLSA